MTDFQETWYKIMQFDETLINFLQLVIIWPMRELKDQYFHAF
jgi:hypothetical protein